MNIAVRKLSCLFDLRMRHQPWHLCLLSGEIRLRRLRLATHEQRHYGAADQGPLLAADYLRGADLDWPRSVLFCCHERQTRCRYPDDGYVKH